jgi:anti-sigma B factor antagonist
MQEYRAAGIITVAVQGELDLLTAPKLAAHIGELLREEPGDVVLDLGETEFIDSAGLAILLNVQRQLERRGRQLRVICDDGPVRRVIELARLGETLGVVP